MASKKYAYYNKANKIAIIEKDDDDGEYKSPLTSVTAGLELNYTIMAGGTATSSGTGDLKDELTELDLNRYQANAVVYFVKAKIAEDEGDMERREFFMREFKRQLEKGASGLKVGPYVVQGFKEMR